MNIPTAEEFAKTYHPMKTYPVDHGMMIKFAKLHVKAALKEASEQAIGFTSVDGRVLVAQNSVLKSYPLTNIK